MPEIRLPLPGTGSTGRAHGITAVLCAIALGLLTPAVHAQETETVDSLKEKIASIEKQLEWVTKDRDGLYEQLSSSIDELESLEAQAAKHGQEIESIVNGRTYIEGLLTKEKENTAALQAELAAANEKLAAATSGGNAQTDKINMLQSSLDSANEQLATATSNNDDQSAEIAHLKAAVETANAKLTDAQDINRSLMADLAAANQMLGETKDSSKAQMADLERAKIEADNIAETAVAQVQSALAERDAIKGELTAAQSQISKLENDLQSTINGRDYIEKLLNDTKAQSQSTIADLQKQLETAQKGRDIARKRLVAAGEEIDALNGQISDMQQELDTAQQSANWATFLSRSIGSRLGDIESVKVTDTSANNVLIQIANTGLFGTGASGLQTVGRNTLNRIGEVLKDEPNTRILVMGHTDNIPVGANSTYANNQDLSFRRAENAMKYLGNNVGIPFTRMSAVGMGDTNPVASNATPEGRSLNRRVELLVYQAR